MFDPEGEQDDVASSAFFSEARVIGQLQHQNIVSVYDAGVGDYEGYIVMEFVEGKSLLQVLKQENTLPLENALNIAEQICHALDYADSKRTVHRDIKPSNIMLTSDNHVKVVDFGISILAPQKQNEQTPLVGSPAYIAPELIHGDAPSVSTDLYSLAVLIYEMILGRLPYIGDDAHAVLYKIVNEQPQVIDEKIPQSMVTFLQKALSKNLNDRFTSCKEFEDQLKALQNEINKVDSNSSYDTGQLQQMQIFEGCSIEILHELASCLIFEKAQPGELLFNESICDEYLCLVQGKALLVAADKHIIIPVGQWLTEKTLHQTLGSYTCKSLSDSLLLRVSKSNLLESSADAQAYFFEFILDRIFVHSV